MVGINKVLHAPVQLVADAEGVFNDYFLKVFNGTTAILSAGKFGLPGCCTLELVRGEDVVHEVAIKVLKDSVLVNVSCKELRVDGVNSTISTNIEVVAILSSNHAKIFALGFCTLTDAATDSTLHLMGRANGLVSVLHANGKANRILDSIPAPCGSHTGLDSTKGLGISMPRLQADGAEFLPDIRKLVFGGTKEIDALCSSNLRVEVVLLCCFTHLDELFRSDFASRNTWDDRVRSSSLHVG
mmetsp:Transcript_1263/g.2262  ORF Transcript_1263/g.2262 Transcript_1263/m.2262 type:complete len:242 (+) Transcript_1263:833-1558(+)